MVCFGLFRLPSQPNPPSQRAFEESFIELVPFFGLDQSDSKRKNTIGRVPYLDKCPHSARPSKYIHHTQVKTSLPILKEALKNVKFS